MTSDLSSASTQTFEIRPSAHPRSLAERREVLTDPAFGTVFTDHMARATWTADGGWRNRRVEAYAPLSLDPAAAVLHYGQEIFEGLKAYRHADGSVWAFRPELNAARFAASARRLALPELPEADFLASIDALVHTDVEWVPTSPGSTLYLRPFMFASESFLGVRATHAAEYLLIASPAGPYFSAGFAPVAIWVDQDFHRAGPGGTGAAKCGGNYAASLLPQELAAQHGCAQVCFLDAATETYIEELGGMNIVMITDDGAVHTPELSGTILEGITRRSILQLLADDGREVHERKITLAEVKEGVASGRITEMFACGTAAIVTPMGTLKGTDFDLTVGDGSAGPVTTEMFEHLTDLQFGRRPDDYGWMRRLV